MNLLQNFHPYIAKIPFTLAPLVVIFKLNKIPAIINTIIQTYLQNHSVVLHAWSYINFQFVSCPHWGPQYSVAKCQKFYTDQICKNIHSPQIRAQSEDRSFLPSVANVANVAFSGAHFNKATMAPSSPIAACWSPSQPVRPAP